MAEKSRLPKYVVEGYWTAVRKALRTQHHLSSSIIGNGVRSFRATLAKMKVGDLICHEPIDTTAQGIIDGGYVDLGRANQTNGSRSSSTRKVG
jgi:hypothetical protein